tara:strand:+ start:610 stop:1062 length:453 start_codon:yes stop_codon:yes gene_type:complete
MLSPAHVAAIASSLSQVAGMPYALTYEDVMAHGLKACDPDHFLLECMDGEDLVNALEDRWNYARNTSRMGSDEKAVLNAGLRQMRIHVLADALAIIKARQEAGWQGGYWEGGPDLKFLNVSEWPIQQAYRELASRKGWSKPQMEAFIASL